VGLGQTPGKDLPCLACQGVHALAEASVRVRVQQALTRPTTWFLRLHLSYSYQRIHISQVAKAEFERSRNRHDQRHTTLLCMLIRARWHSSTSSVMHWPSSQRAANCKSSHLKGEEAHAGDEPILRNLGTDSFIGRLTVDPA
jgi:hypothetical protein